MNRLVKNSCSYAATITRRIGGLASWVAVCAALFTTFGCGSGGAGASLKIVDAARLAERQPETGVPARIRGVITYWDVIAGNCVVQDATGGMRVLLRKDQADIGVGREVEAAGLVRAMGNFAVLIEPTITLVGPGFVPAAHPVTLDGDNLGQYLNQMVTFRATVESVAQERVGEEKYHVRSNRARAVVRASRVNEIADEKFAGGEYQITGVLVRLGDPDDSRQEFQIWSPDVHSFKVIKSPPAPETLPVNSIGSIATLSPREFPDHQLRVHGSLTSTGGALRVTDATGSLALRLKSDADAADTRAADIVGFLNQEEAEVVLSRAEKMLASGSGEDELVSALAVHRLPLPIAKQRIPVRFKGVVTYYKAQSGLLFVQDATDGIFVQAPALRPLQIKAGDSVEVKGVTTPGDFLPNVGEADLRVLGKGEMPAPNLDAERAFSGQMDCRWVELHGIVQEVMEEKGSVRATLVWGKHVFNALIDAPIDQLRPLIDRHVVVRGAIGTVFNSRRQVLGVHIYVPGMAFFQPAGTTPAPLFDSTPRTIESLLQFQPTGEMGHRMRVQGTVTMANPTGPTWIRDRTGGLMISRHEKIDIKPGDVVDVSGFPETGQFGPIMEYSTIRRIRSGPPVKPIEITPEDALDGTVDSQYVSIEGNVVSASVERTDSVTTVRSGPYLFVVRLPLTQPGATDVAARLMPGAQILVTGICSLIVDRHRDWFAPRGFEILMQSPEDLVILRNASWLTLGHVAAILSGMIVLVILGICWITMLRRNVRRQTLSLIAKTGELEAANEIANEAARAAREAETVEQERKVILEMVAKDEPLESIFDVMARTIARHNPGSGCFIKLRVPGQPAILVSSGATDRLLAASASIFSSGDLRMGILTPVVQIAGASYGAVPILRGTERTGTIVTLWLPGSTLSQDHMSNLESWGRFASLAAERRSLYEQLSHRARFDNLTNLHNRASLYEQLDAQLCESAREGGRTGIIYLDLDDFKHINDTFGHDAGDAVLQEVARRIRANIRSTDVAARAGGDEFVVVLSRLRSREEAETIADELVRAIRQPFTIRGRDLHPGASHGIGVFPEDGANLEVLMKAADDDMYTTKSRQKGGRRDSRAAVAEPPVLAS